LNDLDSTSATIAGVVITTILKPMAFRFPPPRLVGLLAGFDHNAVSRRSWRGYLLAKMATKHAGRLFLEGENLEKSIGANPIMGNRQKFKKPSDRGPDGSPTDDTPG